MNHRAGIQGLRKQFGEDKMSEKKSKRKIVSPLHVAYVSLVASEGKALKSGIWKALIRAVARKTLMTEATGPWLSSLPSYLECL